MKTLIVIPRHFENPERSYPFPLGAAFVHASIVARGHAVDILDLNRHVGDPGALVAQHIQRYGSRVVMAGGLTQQFHKLRQIFTAAKAVDPDIVTVGGGGGYAATPTLFSEMTDVDYACIGEAEHVAADLLDALCGKRAADDIFGLVIKKDGKWDSGLGAAQVSDLNGLPSPDYETFGIEEYLERQFPNDFYPMYVDDSPGNLPMTLARSCPYKCTFCHQPNAGTYRQRSLDHFFADLDKILTKHPVRTLSIYDELFASNARKLRAFCERIAPYGLKWVVQLRVDIITPELLETLRAAGCFYISFGIESMSPHILTSMRKRITREQIERALDMTYRAGIGIQGNFIFGDPNETWETFHETIEWWKRHRHYQLNLGMVIPLPGTILFDKALAQGRISDARSYIEAGCPPVNLMALPDADFEEMQQMLRDLQAENPYTGKVVSLARAAGNVYKAQLECSHCKQVHHFERLYLDPAQARTRQRIGCRTCNARSLYVFEPDRTEEPLAQAVLA